MSASVWSTGRVPSSVRADRHSDSEDESSQDGDSTGLVANLPQVEVRGGGGVSGLKFPRRKPSVGGDTCRYDMKHKRRGLAVIINNYYFHPDSSLPDRPGTEKDADRLGNVLARLEFNVRIFDDVTVSDMRRLLRELSQLDHTDNDCFACVVLSHGNDGIVYGADGPIDIADIRGCFTGNKCRSLLGKPKLFFFQACRGSKPMHGVMTRALRGTVYKAARKLPIEADFLLAYSVVPGYYSWINPSRGSWFIQSLSQVLSDHGHEWEIMRILTEVNRIVAQDYDSSSTVRSMDKMKQMPCIESMLTKQLYFPRKRKIASSAPRRK